MSDHNVKQDNDSADLDLEALSNEYMSSVEEQIKRFTENPDMLKKALGPFMKLQSEYMSNPEKLSELVSGMDASGDSFQAEVQDSLKRIRARLSKMDKCLEEIRAMLEKNHK